MHSVHGPGMATVRRVRSGISFDPELDQVLDRNAELLKELGVTRSEVVNAVLAQYFEGSGTVDAVRDVIIRRRLRRAP